VNPEHEAKAMERAVRWAVLICSAHETTTPVTDKFNSDMMFKSLVFIGKPLKMHVLSGNLDALLIDY